jgi:hypothetical protein
LSSRAQTTNVLVNDTWQDGTRTDPAAPTYAENNGVVGTDADSDGNLESAWFNSGNTMTASAGHLITTLPTNGTSSSSWTTYFTPTATPVTLANSGDALKITWVFPPSNVNASSTSSSGLRLAVVDSPSASRVSADGTPGSSTYSGYGMFMNMNTTLASGGPFQLMSRSAPATSSALLSASGSWGALTNGGKSGNVGYVSGDQYTYVMTLTRTASGGVNVSSTMTGDNLNSAGFISVSTLDTNHLQGYTFDTFEIRPSSASDAASLFDTTLFNVQYITSVPEPSTFSLVGIAVAGLVVARRRRRQSA